MLPPIYNKAPMPIKFDRQGFEKVVAGSGLTKSELAKIYGTTRQTVYNWIGGGEPTNGTLLRTYNNVTTGLLRAIAKKLLPYSINVSKDERSQRITTMTKVLHAQK